MRPDPRSGIFCSFYESFLLTGAIFPSKIKHKAVSIIKLAPLNFVLRATAPAALPLLRPCCYSVCSFQTKIFVCNNHVFVLTKSFIKSAFNLDYEQYFFCIFRIQKCQCSIN